MVRKYIIDSLKYWAEEFHIDGFRFDLMGIFDLETMKIIRQELPDFCFTAKAGLPTKVPWMRGGGQ
jgi:pullulanase/glycogen debranching enzyme